MLYGGQGSDLYIVDNTSDQTIENAAEGTDAVQSSVAWTLGSNVENLTLTGSSNIDGEGNADANIITGNSGNNALKGNDGADDIHGGGGSDFLWGGDGQDDLWGDGGADIFVFEATNAYNNIDVIKDFTLGQNDVIDINNLLTAYDPLTDVLTDFVEITTNGSDSVLKVDRDGTGSTYSLTQIALIEGITGLTDEAALVTAGRLVVTI